MTTAWCISSPLPGHRRTSSRNGRYLDRAPYDVWIKLGHLRAVPGAAIDYEFVAFELARLSETTNLVRVNYDRWSIKYLQQALARHGIAVPLEPMGQGYRDMAPAVNELEKLVAANR
jgi:phage terminase large subunit-like protein